MIIAEIGRSKFLLENIQAAETLLQILSKAKQIDETWVGSDYKKITYEEPSVTPISISVQSDTKVLSYSEAMKLKDASTTQEEAAAGEKG